MSNNKDLGQVMISESDEYGAFKSADLHANKGVLAEKSDQLIGFWIYLMSDCLIFAVLFGVYAVMHGQLGGALMVDSKALFDFNLLAINTALLLVSSITYGFGLLALKRSLLAQQLSEAGTDSSGLGEQIQTIKAQGEKSKRIALIWLSATWVLGASFLGIEIYEFAHLINNGFAPWVHSWGSSFFTLVGTHGLHVFFGLIWLVSLMIKLLLQGHSNSLWIKFSCLSMFWHFLDLIWIGVFSFVYLSEFIK